MIDSEIYGELFDKRWIITAELIGWLALQSSTGTLDEMSKESRVWRTNPSKWNPEQSRWIGQV